VTVLMKSRFMRRVLKNANPKIIGQESRMRFKTCLELCEGFGRRRRVKCDRSVFLGYQKRNSESFIVF
jgi:hypothetical protein